MVLPPTHVQYEKESLAAEAELDIERQKEARKEATILTATLPSTLLEPGERHSWRNIAVTLIMAWGWHLSEIA